MSGAQAKGPSRGFHFNVGGFNAILALPVETGKPHFQRTLANVGLLNGTIEKKSISTLRYNGSGDLLAGKELGLPLQHSLQYPVITLGRDLLGHGVLCEVVAQVPLAGAHDGKDALRGHIGDGYLCVPRFPTFCCLLPWPFSTLPTITFNANIWGPFSTQFQRKTQRQR